MGDIPFPGVLMHSWWAGEVNCVDFHGLQWYTDILAIKVHWDVDTVVGNLVYTAGARMKHWPMSLWR